jgi:hypothetical protein
LLDSLLIIASRLRTYDLMSYIADMPISAKLDSDALLSRVKFSDAQYNDWVILKARENFGLFRKQIRPNMIWGWWTQEVAWQLQRFYNEMVEGKRPKLAISSPPQHGKSWAATDFIAYVAGKRPDRKTIFGSYSDDLGVRTNNDLQRIITGEPFKKIFPGTKISEEAISTGGYDRWKRNSSLIEFINHEGSFRNTTVSGPLRDVLAGDDVVAWRKGKPSIRKVVAARESGVDDVFQVRTDGSLVRGNARHPFLVARGDGVEWVKLSDLKVGDLVVQSANICHGRRRDFTENEAWALGFLLGDGWVTVNKKRAKGYNKSGLTGKTYETASWITCIADCPQYPAVAQGAVAVLQDKFDCRFKLTPHGYWRTEKATLGRYLFSFGMADGAKGKRVPPVMYQQTPEIQRAFLDGFADADGSRMVRGNYDVKVILLANRLLIDDLRHMARSLGYRVTNVTEQRRSVSYDLPPNSSVPQEWFSAVFRYHWQSRRDAAFTLSKVKSISPCGREPVFDISVDGDANFIADGLVVHNTRWHVDDVLGRYMERFPELRMLRYPAIAEHDERFRRKGDPLFPELKPLDFLMERKKLLTQPSWESIYQQHPIIVGGGQFPIEKLKMVPFFDTSKVTNSIRYWDKASSDTEDSAFTAGVLMHAMSDGSFVISHVARGQWTALVREQKIRTWTEADAAQYSNYEIYFEQEPGSGGKESAESTVRHLAGFRVYADKVTGHKEVRADPLAAVIICRERAGVRETKTVDTNRYYPAADRFCLTGHPISALRRYHVARLIPAVSHGLLRLTGSGLPARLSRRCRAWYSRSSRHRRSRTCSSVMQSIDLIFVIFSSVRSIPVRRSRQPSVAALYFSG